MYEDGLSMYEDGAEAPRILPLPSGKKTALMTGEGRRKSIVKYRAKIEHFQASMCIHRGAIFLYYFIVNKNKQKYRRRRKHGECRGKGKETD
jgi:hypothetical protein